MAKRLGRIWYKRPRVVSGAPSIGLVTTCVKSADRLVMVWYTALAWSRVGQGSGLWSPRETPIAKSAECGVRNCRTVFREQSPPDGLDASPSTPHSALRIPHLLHAPTGAGSATRLP